MKLDSLDEALDKVLAGATAGSVEHQRLDFKRDPHTVTGKGAPGNPRARLVEELIDAVVCFANAQGGRIVLGIDDKAAGTDAFIGTEADPAFLRNRIYANTQPQLTVPIEELEFSGVRLLVITVPEGLDLVTDSKGRALCRDGTKCSSLSEDARRALAHERRNPDFTARRSERPWRDVDASAMRQARELLSRAPDLRSQMADLDDLSLLRALNLVDRDDRLFIAGEILFCRPAHDSLDLLTRPTAGAEPSVRRLREPLAILLPQALELLRAAIDPEIAHLALSGGQEVALPDFSSIAVDEALTNALVHRDYARPERVVVDHAPNSLKVWSPGALPFGVTEDRLLTTVSTPRNTVLMAAMQQLGLAERASRGIDRMFREQVRVGQKVPGIRADEYSVEVYFTSGAPNRAFAAFAAGLPRAQRENVDVMLTLVHLCQKPTLALGEAARLLQVSEPEARDRLDALTSGPDALIERDGDERRGVRWRLRPATASSLGTAVQHRARADSARPRVESHLKEYGWITNKTIRNMFDLDVQQATQMLNELRAANVVVKDPDGPQRGAQDLSSRARGVRRLVLLVGDGLEPDGGAVGPGAVDDGVVAHHRRAGATVPVLLAGRCPHGLPGAQDDGLAVAVGDQAGAVGADEELAVGVGVPVGAGAGGEADEAGAERGHVVAAEDHVEPDIAGEVLGGGLDGRAGRGLVHRGAPSGWTVGRGLRNGCSDGDGHLLGGAEEPDGLGTLGAGVAAPGRHTVPGVDNRSEVNEFLTTRRARITPEMAGLPATANRRVPGLRRSELATLAGVSVEYYARLERGQIAGASSSVLEALADALQLDDTERAHLYDLARAADGVPASGRARRRGPSRSVSRPSLQWALEAITDAVAFVRDSH
ncbi:hypothetical protein LUZ63_020388 [Rhynchospora breviuscula]|uniref:HTH cro/C1-type domain-containing protein n=1 Tax=Rhynchospora breviuscula TaxID=2022672 RepID=A0A9Q0C0Z7_9POAL|nr:hypothetical protein LUZ63_020388 [Rhynchospora breviuscula]